MVAVAWTLTLIMGIRFMRKWSFMPVGLSEPDVVWLTPMADDSLGMFLRSFAGRPSPGALHV